MRLEEAVAWDRETSTREEPFEGSGEESGERFTQVAEKLRNSEEALMRCHELPKTCRKYRNNWAFVLGIKLCTCLGLDKRIRQ